MIESVSAKLSKGDLSREDINGFKELLSMKFNCEHNGFQSYREKAELQLKQTELMINAVEELFEKSSTIKKNAKIGAH